MRCSMHSRLHVEIDHESACEAPAVSAEQEHAIPNASQLDIHRSGMPRVSLAKILSAPKDWFIATIPYVVMSHLQVFLREGAGRFGLFDFADYVYRCKIALTLTLHSSYEIFVDV